MNRTLNQVKAGDRVWVDEIGKVNGRDRSLRTVVKLTPTQIVVDCPWGRDRTERFQRGKAPRFPHLDRSPTYYQIGHAGWYTPEIQRIATVAECAQWDVDQETRKLQQEDAAAQRKAREDKRDDLNKLFGASAYVQDAHNNTAGEWQVSIYTDEQGVRQLAEYLSK